MVTLRVQCGLKLLDQMSNIFTSQLFVLLGESEREMLSACAAHPTRVHSGVCVLIFWLVSHHFMRV